MAGGLRSGRAGADLGGAVRGDRAQPAVVRGGPAVRDASGDQDDLASSDDPRLMCAQEEGSAALEDDDDVQSVFSNFEVEEAVMARLTAA